MTGNDLKAIDSVLEELNQARNRYGTKEGLLACLRHLSVDYAAKNGHSITFDVSFGDGGKETISAIIEPSPN